MAIKRGSERRSSKTPKVVLLATPGFDEIRQQAACVVIILKLYVLSRRIPRQVKNMFVARKRKKLEKERQRVLDNISYERWDFELMAQRAQAAGETPNADILKAALARFSEFEQQATAAKNIDDFDDLIEKAEMQGTLRAYICPMKEVVDEGNVVHPSRTGHGS